MTAKLLLVLSILLAAGGAGLLASERLVPYDWIRPWLDRSAADGSADTYTLAVHLAIVSRLRYVGLGLILVAAVLCGTRGRLVTAARWLRVGAEECVADAGRAARRAWSESRASHWVALLVIMTAGFGMRLWLLGVPMRYDESYTFLTYARSPLILGLTKYDTPNNHLFHTFLVHIAYRLFGDAPWVLRLPALAAGMLVVPASYVAVRSLYGRDAGLLGAALVAMSMAAISSSTNARGHSIVTLLFLMLLCLGVYVRRSNNSAGWALIVMLGALAMGTIPSVLYGFAAIVAWLLLSTWTGNIGVPRWRFLVPLTWTVAVTGLTVGILYAPILVRTDLMTLLGTPINSLMAQPVPWGRFVEGNVGKVIDTWDRWASDWPWWLRAVWLTGIVAAAVLHRRVARDRVPLLAGLVLGCIPLLLIQRVVPPARTWIFLLPVFAGMGAAGALELLGWCVPRRWMSERWGRRAIVGAALLLVAGGVLSLPERSRRYSVNLSEFPDAERVVTFLMSRLQPGDKVLVLGLSQTVFLYYASHHGLPYLTYFYDYLLEGWGRLRDARRIFVVVNEREHTLEYVLAEARLADASPPVTIGAFESSRIYLLPHR